MATSDFMFEGKIYVRHRIAGASTAKAHYWSRSDGKWFRSDSKKPPADPSKMVQLEVAPCTPRARVTADSWVYNGVSYEIDEDNKKRIKTKTHYWDSRPFDLHGPADGPAVPLPDGEARKRLASSRIWCDAVTREQFRGEVRDGHVVKRFTLELIKRDDGVVITVERGNEGSVRVKRLARGEDPSWQADFDLE